MVLRALFYFIFFGVGIWMMIAHIRYYQKARELDKRTDTSFGDLFYGSRVTFEENFNFYKDLFRKQIKNSELRKLILNVKLSYLAAILTLVLGILIFNLF